MVWFQSTVMLVSVFLLTPFQKSDQEIRYLFAGMEQERAKLWSGSYEVEGVDPRWGPIKAIVLFENEKLRISKEIGSGTKKWVTHACDNGIVIGVWTTLQQNCHINRSNEKERETLYYWNPKTAGLAMFNEPDYRKELSNRLKGWLPISTVTTAGALRTIFCASANEFQDTPVQLTINCENGFTPIRNWAEIRFKANSAKPGRVELNYDVTAKWNKLDDVWVPVHHRDVNGANAVNAEYRLKWNWVNRKVDDKEFTVEALNVPAGYKIIDFRNSTPENPAGEQILASALTAEPSMTKYLLWYAGAVMVALAIIWYWLRKPRAA